MSGNQPTQPPGDKMKKVIKAFAEQVQLNPDKPKKEILRAIEIQFDLSPLECEFLNKHFS